MKYLARLCVCVLTAVVLFVGLSRVIGSWSGQEMTMLQLEPLAGLRVAPHRSAQASWRDGRPLPGDQESRRCRDSRRTPDVAGGALRFQEANELIEKGDWDLMADYYVPDSNEAVCEQTLAWVHSEAVLHPGDATTRIVEGLEKEFQRMFGRPYADSKPPEDLIQFETDAPAGDASVAGVAG